MSLFLLCDAMQVQPIAMVCVCVCMSVCVSVCNVRAFCQNE